ncbi:acyl-CoA dehydrogenase [Alcanivorax balearicus MACL04]|uniref:Acyl-CoA dehydrogenase n=1 Tax=Alloalcanivorax balearicus MACL04 TaxID=1177182 RepID=A0ABT2R3V6_9GAMM|nr:acyl-CoA dehydrogenase family protein [Alloalcanivorax balearicus]MCU5784451.1 acyl-CoA dehydrogenase [Alloalcanivorax balearicus MACL04]
MRLNDEQQMLQDSVARLMADKGPVSRLRELRDSRDEKGYDQPLWQAMVEAGLTGILVPEEHGGIAFGLVGAGLVAQEIGRNLSVTPFLSTAVLGATALSTGATAEQQSKWLPAIAEGTALVALAVDEGAKHRPDSLNTRYEGGKISGDKLLVLDGHVADLLLVAATDGSDSALYLVDPKASGVTIERTIMADNRNAARIQFDNVEAEPMADGAAALQAALRAGRAVLAAELAGLSREVFERTLGYLKERKQFGRLIGTFQALQHRAAQLMIDVTMTEALALQALDACDNNADDADAQVFAAKGKAARTALLAGQEGVQMHGGIGMTDEFDIGFFLKRARAGGETLGDANFCADRFATLGGY